MKNLIILGIINISENLIIYYPLLSLYHKKLIKLTKNMKKIILFLAIISIIFSQFAILTPFVQASNFLELKEQEGFGGGGEIPAAYGESGKPTDVRSIVANIIRAFLGLLGIIFLILLVAAGYKYMTAGGNEDQIKEAKKQIMHALIGLLIIMAAYAITIFVIGLVTEGADGYWIFDF